MLDPLSRKKTAAFICLTLCILSFTVPAYAVGSIDSIPEDAELTEEELKELDKSVSEAKAEWRREHKSVSSDRQYIQEADPKLSMSYSAETGVFTYRMPNRASFMLNAPLGGITDEPVDIDAGEETWIVSLLEDGISCLPAEPEFHSVSEALASVSTDRIAAASVDHTGSYLFHIRSTTTDRSGRQTYDVYGGVRIVSDDIPVSLTRLEAPYGYEISEVILDGRRIAGNTGERIELVSDGYYEVHFMPLTPGLPEWISHFKRDATPPALVFSPKLTAEPMDGPVTFTPTEGGAQIKVSLDNIETKLYNMTAAAAGRYVIEVSDSAGNSSEYSFTVKMRKDTPIMLYLSAGIILIILAVLVAALAHRRMRII